MIPSHRRQRLIRRSRTREVRALSRAAGGALRRADALPPQRDAVLSPRQPDRHDGALRPRDGGAAARQPAVSAGVRARRFRPSIGFPPKTPVPLFVQADFGLDAESASPTGGDPGLPFPVRVPAGDGRSVPRSVRARRRPAGAARRPRCTGIPRAAARGHRGQTGSRERGAAGDRPRAPEDAPRFPGDRAAVSACAPSTSAAS